MTARRVQVACRVLSTLVECAATAEIVWYLIHNGDQTLHEAVAEWWQEACERARERTRIRHTLNMIRELPEE